MKSSLAKYMSIAVILSILVLVCVSLGCSDAVARPANRALTSTSKIGIIAAMEPELDLLRAAVLDPVEEHVAGMSFHVGKIGNHPVVLSKCGVGKVSAALGTQILIDRYSPDYIVNTGCAGALQPDIAVSDIVLASSTVEWDLDTTACGDPRGYVQALDQVEMVADPELTKQIERHVPSILKLHEGLIISGDSFIDKQEQRDMLLGYFPEAQCVEMEGSAVGHVCAQNNVPFCVLRCISDDSKGSGAVEYEKFVVEASRTAAAIMLSFLRDETL